MRAEAVRKRILRGATIHMGFADGVRVWWFDEPYRPVADSVMREVLAGSNGGPLLIEAGDSLFGWEGQFTDMEVRIRMTDLTELLSSAAAIANVTGNSLPVRSDLSVTVMPADDPLLSTSLPSVGVLRRLLEFDERTSTLYWRERPLDLCMSTNAAASFNKIRAGKPAGDRNGGKVTIFGRPYPIDDVVDRLISSDL